MTSVRAQIITKRTYCRPLDSEGKKFETWEDVTDRVIRHQAWLWERALDKKLNNDQRKELEQLRSLLLGRYVAVSGRTLWLGGTEIAKRREASQFNCAHLKVETIHDVVDALWLLLQGCGVGFTPVVGTLSGFTQKIDNTEVLRSSRKTKGGREINRETFDRSTGTWTISIGDSAEAWAKSIGKILAFKGKARRVVIDLSQLRPAGDRLSGYGWISSGDGPITKAYQEIIKILNKNVGQLLSKIDILDIMNWLGTILSSRRSAEIALVTYGSPEWEPFAYAKEDLKNNPQRGQSNNSLVFWKKPSKEELDNVFNILSESGGSEPGIINGEAARIRAPWFSGVNPCAEILLGNKSFCNLSELDIGKFRDNSGGMESAAWVLSRANYRQTLVNLDDGILQRTWHENNEYLRLCGVGLTGIALRDDLGAYDFKKLKNIVVHGAYSMADELGTQRPKNVTTIKPSGTLSKIMDTTEGCHKPKGKYFLNNINFSVHDPMVKKLRESGYKTFPNPTDDSGVVVSIPMKWEGIRFNKDKDGYYVCDETAVEQLERYKLLMGAYVEQNCSITVYYKNDEIPSIVSWLLDNWDSYVGVSFLPRTDPSEDQQVYAYLPQELISEGEYEEYVSQITLVDLDDVQGIHELEDDECEQGVCPVK